MNYENLQNRKETVHLQDLGIDKEDSIRRDLNQQYRMARTGLIWFTRTGLIWFRKDANEYGNEPADSTRSLPHSVCLLIRCYNAPVLSIIPNYAV